MKGIKLCAECANYSTKLHKCTAGAVDEGKAQDSFYADCPLPDVVEVVRCKDCKHMTKAIGLGTRYCKVWSNFNGMGDEGFCNYGERKEQ